MLPFINNIMADFIFVILHLENENSFPPPLTKSEESKLLKLAAEDSQQAKNKLISHNLRLVVHIIKKYYSNYADRDDLISVGTIGLIKGINSFDCKKGTRLATYASKCIENEILMYFRTKKKSENDISMNDPIETDSEGNPLTLADILYSEDNISDDIDLKLKCIQLNRIIKTIPEGREKQILILRYGLDGNTPLTQRETADLMKISRSYVSRIEKKMLNKLKNELENNNCLKEL